MLFDVFQCMKNVLAQLDTVDKSTVSKNISRTTVRHEVAFKPGNPMNRCFLFVFFMMHQLHHLQSKHETERKMVNTDCL